MNKDYEFYINYTLFDKQIDRMEHKTEKIIYVYCEKCVYIFNFASKGKEYIRTVV
tara:strand:- start:236 stop:400 length:165 start_codon:yes stop_codon:yes gene_type:complete